MMKDGHRDCRYTIGENLIGGCNVIHYNNVNLYECILFPGLWEVPFNAHFIESYEGGHCPYLDQCVLHHHDSDDVRLYIMNIGLLSVYIYICIFNFFLPEKSLKLLRVLALCVYFTQFIIAVRNHLSDPCLINING